MKRDAMCKKIKDYMGTPYTSTCMLRYKEFHIGMTRLVKNKWEWNAWRGNDLDCRSSGCGAQFRCQHALDWKKCGLVTKHSNKVHDALGDFGINCIQIGYKRSHCAGKKRYTSFDCWP